MVLRDNTHLVCTVFMNAKTSIGHLVAREMDDHPQLFLEEICPHSDAERQYWVFD